MTMLESTDDSDKWYTVTLPPTERVSFRLPRTFTTGSHLVRWPPGAIIGGVSQLNLFEGPSVGMVFRTSEPKVLCFYDKKVTTMAEIERTFGQAVQPFLEDVIAMTAGEDGMKEVGVGGGKARASRHARRLPFLRACKWLIVGSSSLQFHGSTLEYAGEALVRKSSWLS